ncbi:unnamed protein product, partial [Strongylus vulgaris]
CAHDGVPGWEYGGCSFSVQHGITASRKLLTKTPVIRTPLRNVEKHNLKAGRLVCPFFLVSQSNHVYAMNFRQLRRPLLRPASVTAFLDHTTSGRVCAWRNQTHAQGDCGRLCCGKGF